MYFTSFLCIQRDNHNICKKLFIFLLFAKEIKHQIKRKMAIYKYAYIITILILEFCEKVQHIS